MPLNDALALAIEMT